MSNALDLVTGDIYSVQDDFARVLADPYISFEREAGFAIQALSGNDYALKVATGSPAGRRSVVNAVTNVAAIGISLNPAQKHAYLVPRKVNGQVQIVLDLSYMGLIEIAVASGSILWAQAEPVFECEADAFVLREAGQPPLHPRKPFAKREAKGEVVGVYVVAKTAEGDFLTTWMTTEDINDIRDRSEAWKSGKSCPWRTDWLEMAKKTVVKRAYKMWPRAKKDEQRARLAEAINYLNTDGGEGLADIAQPGAAGSAFDLAAWIAKATAQTIEADLMDVYHEGIKAAAEAKDRAGLDAFRVAAAEHRRAIQAKDAARTVDMPTTEGAAA